VRFAGDRVAMVVAETLAAAREAAELVLVRYRPLPAAVTPTAARAAGAPVHWEAVPDNTCYRYAEGDHEATEQALDRADHVVRSQLIDNRMITNFIEPRAAIGLHDAATDRFTLYTGTQMPHRVRASMAAAFARREGDFRVVVPVVGGSFGSKMSAYAEQALVLWVARKLGRPVKWLAEKGEGFATNPLGAKGAAEGGTVAAPPAVINALLNVLRFLGVRHIDTPATPHRVWQAIQAARLESGPG
jgi:carbon-monoxide dehydrogenase large subunit